MAKLTILFSALLAALVIAVPVQAAGFQSDNVRSIGKLPDAAGAISARFSPDGKLMYVSSATGLGIYRSDENLVNSGNSGPSNPDEAQTGRLDFLYHNSMRLPGGYMAVTEEDYTRPGCNGQGSFQTLKITKDRNSDGTIKLEPRGFFTTELNELLEQKGRSPATANCSAHWFDYSKGLIAQGWYDQGVRFLDVRKPDTPKQVGFYATTGTFWGAYYAPLDSKKQIVYALDTTSGIDVLRIDRGSLKTVKAPAKAPSNRSSSFTPSAKFRYACPLLKV